MEDSTMHSVIAPENIYSGISDLSDDDEKKELESVLPLIEPLLPPALSPDIISTTISRTVVALYTYKARDGGDLNFRKRDRLGILDDSDADWWFARHLTEMTEGYIPRNYVEPEKNVEFADWFFGNVSREDAEKMLMIDFKPRGTFLIRNREKAADVIKGAYSLSFRDWNYEKSDHVKHYKIEPTDDGGFCITRRKTFVTLQKLVDYYSEGANGLSHRLTIPCPKIIPKNIPPVTRDEWEISRSSLQLIRKLDSGNFADMYYGKWNLEIDVTVKIVRSNRLSSDAFLTEATIMKQLRHEKLISLYAVCSIEEPFLIVTEYMVNGNLLDYLRKREGRNLRLSSLIDMAAQVASGMAYLESKQVIHRDLAARNIVVGDSNVKVAGFGLAKIIEGSEYIDEKGFKFPIKWIALEAAFLGKFSSKSDVWSYGILLYELITYGRFPYPGMGNHEVLEKVLYGYRMPKPTKCECPDSIYSMMLKCWDYDPKKRPTFEFLFGFFNDYFVSTEPGHLDS